MVQSSYKKAVIDCCLSAEGKEGEYYAVGMEAIDSTFKKALATVRKDCKDEGGFQKLDGKTCAETKATNETPDETPDETTGG